jgi:type II secretory pathway pseudopilin PulG
MNLVSQSKVQSGGRSAAGGSIFSRRTALTLLEMMVAVTLLAVIMVGLLAMFQYTQRALHVAHTQTDVFENARGAIQLVARDLAEMTPHSNPNVVSSYANWFANPMTLPDGFLTLPSGTNQPFDFTETFWLSRMNDEWRGIGYFVLDDPVLRTNYGVGTLYRFSGVVREPQAPDLFAEYNKLQPTNTHRVSDGVVHFSIAAIHVETNLTQTNFIRQTSFTLSNVLPAFVDVEIGVLEPATLKQFQAIRSIDLATAQKFLTNHVGRIHFFRERVPIHNFLNPHRANEVL